MFLDAQEDSIDRADETVQKSLKANGVSPPKAANGSFEVNGGGTKVALKGLPHR